MPFDWGSFLGENIGAIFKDIVGSFKVDPTVALQVQERLQEAQIALQAKIIDQVDAQIQVNLAEAQSKSVFVAGWRPAIGWVCGAAFTVQFIVAPLATWLAELAGHPVRFPTLDMSTMLPVLLGMLGLGTMGTVEKVTKGDSNCH